MVAPSAPYDALTAEESTPSARSTSYAGGRTRRPPKSVTKEGLREGALSYLDRFDATVGKLRDVLSRQVQRAALHHETSIEQAHHWIEEILVRFQASGPP